MPGPVLQVVHRVLAGFLLRQPSLKPEPADGGAVTLIQRSGSVTKLMNIHLHCLVLEGVCRRTDGGPVFVDLPVPTPITLLSGHRAIEGSLLQLATKVTGRTAVPKPGSWGTKGGLIHGLPAPSAP